MIIQLEEPGRLKILLTEAELHQFSLSYEQLDYSDPTTRRALGALMAEASAETGFRFRPGQLLIEAFPAPAGGCALYFTLLDEGQTSGRLADAARSLTLKTGGEKKRGWRGRLRLKTAGNYAYVFEFADVGDLLDAVEQLYIQPDAVATRADLYLLNGRYRLLLHPRPGDHKTSMLLGEYAAAACHTAAAAAYTAEHGRLLAKDRAVQQIGKAFHAS